jgi:subtilisin-like proprotein convertase family protein
LLSFFLVLFFNKNLSCLLKRSNFKVLKTKIMKKYLLFLLLFGSFSIVYSQDSSLWKKLNSSSLTDFSSARLKSSDADGVLQVYELDLDGLKVILRRTTARTFGGKGVVVSMPNSKGGLDKFLVWENSNFSPDLQALYPQIKAYSGVGITDASAVLYFSFSPEGLQAMTLRSDSDSEFIAPLLKGKAIYGMSLKNRKSRTDSSFACKTVDANNKKVELGAASRVNSSAKVFKTFRLALSCTGEYTKFHGGTKEGALAAMNATMTRVNGIFNRDLALKLELILETSSLIYTDPKTDPYSDAISGVKGSWNLELQSNLTNVIGNEKYDIGHLFGASGGGGDAGCIGCLCVDPVPDDQYGKGSAFTSPSNGKPEGDFFDVDYVAHEMGHQLGANHTFTFEYEDAGVGVEPGSGSTIMGYAGITDYDVQGHSDDYFAQVSIRQIQDNLEFKNCSVNSPIANTPPVVNAGVDYVIPKGTPFVLSGSGSDVNGDVISYAWEQNDPARGESGAQSVSSASKTSGPTFRFVKPSSSPVRYMPSFDSVLLNKLTTKWESVSGVARDLNFVLIGRDNALQGTAQTNSDEMKVVVSAAAGPFVVTSQDVVNIGWSRGAYEMITWDVKGTNLLSGASLVSILLSTDGGQTFSTVLASNTPNDGSQLIVVPDLVAKDCRIMIKPTANIFYSINSQPFAIGYTVTSNCTTYDFNASFAIPDANLMYTSKDVNVISSEGTVSDVNVSLGLTHAYLSDIQVEIQSPQGLVVKLLERDCGAANLKMVLNYDDLGGVISCGISSGQLIAPFEPLKVFNDQNAQGVWSLRVRDVVSGGLGTIDSATITLCAKTYTLSNPSFVVEGFVLYPNPNEGNFNIKFTSLSKKTILVTINDLLGKKYFEKVYDSQINFNENIKFNHTLPGVYLLSISDGDRKNIKKIVVK